jgi:hypothetical protein
MRMMLRWTVPVEKGNAMIDDGSMRTVVEAVMAKTKPEAAYFHAEGGKRSGLLFFDMKEPSDIPRIADPFSWCGCSRGIRTGDECRRPEEGT